MDTNDMDAEAVEDDALIDAYLRIAGYENLMAWALDSDYAFDESGSLIQHTLEGDVYADEESVREDLLAVLEVLSTLDLEGTA